MARPDLSDERSTQILDAFERCVVRQGLAETTLHDVAEEAGVKRSLIRHYLGNRNALVSALLERLLLRSRTDLDDMRMAFRDPERIGELPAFLLPGYDPESTEKELFAWFLVSARREPAIADFLTTVHRDFASALRDILKSSRPHAQEPALRSVASGIVSICNDYWSMSLPGCPAVSPDLPGDAIKRLIASLDT